MIMKNRLADEMSLGGKDSGSRRREGLSGEALDYAAAVEKYVVDHPIPALVVALAAGVMLAWWIKRR
jgi:ElaB/YqjD/DUF883 family membrane-anchored ribosome-binding protein